MAKKVTKQSNQTEIEKLRAENVALKKQLQEAEKTSVKTKKKLSLKSFTKWASVALAGAIFIVASFILYAGNTLVNTNRFMKAAGPLIEQPAVQQAVAEKTTNALFEQVDVEQLATEVLPEKVDFLAPTLATQIQQYTEKQAQKVLENPTFQQNWNNFLQNAHQRTITRLENYEGDGTIDVNDAFKALTERLQGGKLNFLVGKSLPPKVGNITLIQSEWLPYAHTFVANFQTFRILTIVLFFLLLILAVLLSSNRRKMLMILGWMIAILSVIMLVALRITKNIAVHQADPQYQQAANEIWNVLTRPLGIQIITSLIIGLALATVAWLGSQSKGALRIRKSVDALFAGKLHESLFQKENSITRWFGKFQRPLLILIGVGFVVSFLVIPLSLMSIIGTVIVCAILALLVISLSASQS